MTDFKYNKSKTIISVVLLMVFLAGFSINFLRPGLSDDSQIVLATIDYFDTGAISSYFWPVRLITSSLYVTLILLVSKIFNSVLFSWLLLNSIFYILAGTFFYLILEKIFNNKKTAIIGALFLSANYAIVVSGLSYLVDIGAWFFYILCLYFLSFYVDRHENKWLLLSAVSVGVGGLFKEFAFQGFIAIFVILLYENYRNPLKFVKKIFLPATLAFLLAFLTFAYVFFRFDYTYLDWFKTAQLAVSYKSRIIEYIKSIGSLLNFLIPFFLAGIYYFWKSLKGKEVLIENKYLPYVFAVIISALPAFIWPAITQRILFIIVPSVVIISCFCIKKLDKFWYVFIPIILVYYSASLYMDSFVLKFVNLPF